MEKARELDHLFEADRRILELHAHIGKQRVLIERLKRMDQPAELAVSLLKTLEETLRVFQGHRELILATLKGGPEFPNGETFRREWRVAPNSILP
jgi:hypothetical protein